VGGIEKIVCEVKVDGKKMKSKVVLNLTSKKMVGTITEKVSDETERNLFLPII
jgi:hypothetical protein